jgi:hypothetical protein
MALKSTPKPVGTGQQGAASPTAEKETPTHIRGHKPEDKIEDIANQQAREGLKREHREDPEIFTK